MAAKKEKNMVGTMGPDPMPAHAPVQKDLAIPMVLIASSHVHNLNLSSKQGIDVSHYQGRINWQQVASTGISYVYAKATEGESFVDDTYAYNIREARKYGISVGAYHFYRTNVSVDKQFANLTRIVKKEDCDLVPMIDVETRGSESTESFLRNLYEFVKRVEKYYGRKPLLYSYQNFYNKNMSGEFKNYPWMMAKYHEEPPILNNGPDYCTWQYSSTGILPGIKGKCDRSKLVGRHSLKEIEM